ncbi:uncharacterized protein B0H18DRAFT_1012680 [Fomitopsis serialis]|uniref:uncharacterized protein n=1 Tax=Fomitopsis serialis TaxID=139415 RepID=UPI00200871D4|nr:uncharacterized protein B0H18DRAFT_1012680 [Neoantrodia serialis]KAH9924177.1 hypothetical protein B0H18DRAFT_1012680 [Neoantrodia serialis]
MSTPCFIDRCNQPIDCSRQAISSHLKTVHQVNVDSPVVQACQWSGCRVSVPASSLASHIMTVHMR